MGTASGPFGTECHDYEGSLGRWAIIPDVKRGLGDRRSVRCLENQRGQNSGKGIADARSMEEAIKVAVSLSQRQRLTNA